MNIQLILSAIDDQISKLEQARAMLTSVESPAGKRGLGRPKNVLTQSRAKKRILSPEARAKIAAAQKKRWAAAKKAK